MKALRFLILLLIISACQQMKSDDSPAIKKGMIKMTIFYPNGDGKTFDMDYYTNKHMVMIARTLGGSLKGMSIDKGLAGATPETPIPYLAIGHLYFENMTSFQNSMGPHAKEFRADVPNYTNIQPVIQVSEVMQ